MSNVDLSYACTLKPEDVIKYFEEKGFRISWDWHDTWQEAHSKAFTVAKMTQMDLLKDTKSIVQKAIDEGWTEQQFIKQASPMLKAKGWWGKEVITDENGEEKTIQKGSPYRLKTIFRTNVQTAYMAGRYKQQMENIDIEPFFEYVAVLDSRTRPEHRALNGTVKRHDDPFWDNFYPPNGWGCRCRVRAVDEDYLKENNITPESSNGKISEEWRIIDKNTGEARQVSVYNTGHTKVETDPGWSYNPGKAWYQPDLEQYPYEVAKQYTEGTVTGPPFEQFYNQAQNKANEALEAVFDEKFKKDKLREHAVTYFYKNLPKEEKDVFEYIAVLDSEKRSLLSTEKQAVKLSIQSLGKNLINHPELKLEEYFLIPELVDKTETLVYLDKTKKQFEKVVCFANKGKYYSTVIKSTGDKQENYLQSFHVTDLKEIIKETEKKGVKVIFDNLTKKTIS